MVCLSFSRLQKSLFFPLNRFFKAPALCEIFVSRVEPGTPSTFVSLHAFLIDTKTALFAVFPFSNRMK